MKTFIFFIVIILALAFIDMDKVKSFSHIETGTDTITMKFQVNDSLLYEATFIRNQVDSVTRGLKDHATPLTEKYIKK